ncbi:hypothetical protein EV356DRAFT_190904 [Viridothelium virens]|uniref:Uncharacterized protein n=1 Tax=Viridothelium virens TaxID=1048519 RepID=A0A6A6H6Z6_VIRVR|nr:hypothetical protein EV356DRAFT_190904 [Viridothelium virens]
MMRLRRLQTSQRKRVEAVLERDHESDPSTVEQSRPVQVSTKCEQAVTNSFDTKAMLTKYSRKMYEKLHQQLKDPRGTLTGYSRIMHEHTRVQMRAALQSRNMHANDEAFLMPILAKEDVALPLSIDKLTIGKRKESDSSTPKRCAFATKVAERQSTEVDLTLPSRRRAVA